jgi:glycosyltransferase involved in cell wall biosynthesis
MVAPPLRSALVQDWFFAPGGSEQVAMELARMLPLADVHTTFADASSATALGNRLHPWPLQRVLGPTRGYRSLLPLYPLWFGALDLRRYDLVISSSSAFAKAVRTRRDAVHIAYIHTPMRFAWDLESYVATSSFALPSRLAARTLRPLLQRWDVRTARRPDILVANSAAVRERIRRHWGRDAEVIHPPVETDEITLSSRDDGFLLTAARMVGYRRIDLAVEAANRTGRQLVLVGAGPEEKRLRALAGPTIRFMGQVDRPTLVDLFARCHAYVVPGEEDFGIAPVEAMAAGKPVVAYRAGGAIETVIEERTGVFFDEPSSDALAEAFERLDAIPFDRRVIRANAERFGVATFRSAWSAVLGRSGVGQSLFPISSA